MRVRSGTALFASLCACVTWAEEARGGNVPPPAAADVAGQVAKMVAEVERIWGPAAVRFDWRHEKHLNDELDPGHVAVVLIEGGSSSTLGSLHRIRSTFSYSPPCGRPDALVRISLGAARRALAEPLLSGESGAQLVRLRLPTFLARILAHELGHYLLDTREHGMGGLMKPRLERRDALPMAHVGLESEHVARVRSLWAQRRVRDLVASSAAITDCSVAGS
jgi:hypothetical protein